MQNETTPAPADDLVEAESYDQQGSPRMAYFIMCQAYDKRTDELTARIQSDAEKIATLEAQIKTLREAGETLRQEATMHCQNSMACAVNHYGEDFSVHGMPGWIATSQDRIEQATQALAATEPKV